MYTHILNNPKIQKLPDKLVKSWLNLLCLASDNGGALPAIEQIAFALRVSETAAETLIETLVQRHLFDRTQAGVLVHDWNDWQYPSSVSTDRVKRYRERSRNGGGNGGGTFHETHQRQNRTEQTPSVSKNGLEEGGLQPTSECVKDDAYWRETVRFFLKTKIWPRSAGVEPGYAGCEVPKHLIAEFNLDGLSQPAFMRRSA